MTLDPTRLGRYADDPIAFLRDAGAGLWPWQEKLLKDALQRRGGRFRRRFVCVSLPRGNGKSYLAAMIACWRLFTGPAGQDIISVALDAKGARVVRAYALRLIERNPLLAASATIFADEIVVDTGRDAAGLPRPANRWTVEPADHTSTRGRHPTAVLYDEIGWAPNDELFASLTAAQAPVDDPLFLVASTVGAARTGPLWELKQLADARDPSVYFYWTNKNPSPLVTDTYLSAQRRLVHPVRFSREHLNTWTDGADAFLSADLLEAAFAEGWPEQESAADEDYFAFVDLGLVHDATAIAVTHKRADGSVALDRLLTFKGTRKEPVRVADVLDAVTALDEQFGLRLVRVESPEGGESLVQSLRGQSVNAETLRPTQKTQQEAWGNLLSLFQNGRLVLFRHERLREELLNLQIKNTPTGFRVFDPGAIHQDHALALAGASLAACGGGMAGPLATDLMRAVERPLSRPENTEWRTPTADGGAVIHTSCVAADERADAGEEDEGDSYMTRVF